jgi:hypothetical protein
MGKKRFRGVPPPLSFSIGALADDALLTEIEVAAASRESIIGVSKKRLAASDGLEWRYINGRPRCTVGSLKKKLAGSDMRLPSVLERVRAGKATRPAKPVSRPRGRPRLIKAEGANAA